MNYCDVIPGLSIIFFAINFTDPIVPFLVQIRHIFDKFVETQVEECLSKCRDDLKGMTRFVTWDVDGKGGSSALYKYVRCLCLCTI
jgi:hypothetical protein